MGYLHHEKGVLPVPNVPRQQQAPMIPQQMMAPRAPMVPQQPGLRAARVRGAAQRQVGASASPQRLRLPPQLFHVEDHQSVLPLPVILPVPPDPPRAPAAAGAAQPHSGGLSFYAGRRSAFENTRAHLTVILAGREDVSQDPG